MKDVPIEPRARLGTFPTEGTVISMACPECGKKETWTFAAFGPRKQPFELASVCWECIRKK